jgi:hypothetical protein
MFDFKVYSSASMKEMPFRESVKNIDKLAKSLGMAKLKVRYTRSSGVAKAEAYMWYAEHFATRYDAVDRTFWDAIKYLSS